MPDNLHGVRLPPTSKYFSYCIRIEEFWDKYTSLLNFETVQFAYLIASNATRTEPIDRKNNPIKKMLSAIFSHNCDRLSDRMDT
jgi:hypothetical protein